MHGDAKSTLSTSVVEMVRDLVMKHNEWRGRCINLIASENITSPAIREVLTSDLAHRYAEGKPSHRHYRGSRYIDEIETIAVQLAERLFRVDHVNVVPISGCQAVLAMFYALTKPGDTIMSLGVPNGGHISYMEFGGAGVRGLRVKPIPFDPKEMNIDTEAAVKSITETKPTLVLLGGSVILFPQPVREMREAVEEYGGYLGYDAAHVLGLIAGGMFQDPYREGAHIIPGSTHKTFPGPQGGIIFCEKKLEANVDKAVFPGLTSNHHLHRLAGLAIALAEMEKYGKEYAAQIVKNAKALAEALHSLGFNVLCSHKDFTESHQVLVDVAKFGGGDYVSGMLEQANIICNKNLLPWDDLKKVDAPSGIRLGVQEVTRLGMKETDMQQVAEFIKQTVIDGRDQKEVASEVGEFIGRFQTIKYAFNSKIKAYEYMRIL
ncbi:MAG: serine hydroxymethyltransferase [Candidatus Bathyarchaeia archaeon]